MEVGKDTPSEVSPTNLPTGVADSPDIPPQNSEQNPINQNPPPTLPEKKKINYWMVSTLALCLLAILGGTFYYLNYKNRLVSQENNSIKSPSTNPIDTAPLVSSTIMKSNQIRVGGLQLTYPDSWVPIFAVPSDGKNVIYFARSENEAQKLANCASQNSCSNYSLKLEDFANYAIWQNSTTEDFIKQVRSDIQLGSLQKTTIGGRVAWVGYIDSQKTKYQTVIETSTSQSKSFTAITASTTNPNSEAIDEYVTKLSKIKVGDYKAQNAKELTNKKGFALEFTSSLDPKESDTSLLTFILDSLLAPKNSSKSYTYLLYTASTKTADGSVGGPNYPTTNYFNNKYYLLTDNDQLVDGVYGTPQIQIKLSTSNTKDLGLYLADPKYCTQDSDCQYRANFCSIGAYNPYHQYSTPWGCGMPDYENLGYQETVREKAGCQSDFDVKYDSLKCVSNSCQTVNAKIVCKP